MSNKFPFFRFLVAFWLCNIHSHTSFAQTASDYLFYSYQAPYAYLPAGTSVPAIQVNNGVSSVIPIGFSFNYAGNAYTGIKASTEGWITFNTSYNSSSQNTNSLTALSSIAPALFPFWDDLTGLADTSITPIPHIASYQTTGTAPNRVFTFEWRNWGGDFPGNFISFQVKLSETSNKIEFLYKKEPFPNSNYPPAASIGICSDNGVLNYLSLSNALLTPLALSSVFTDSIDSRPSTSQVYAFIPPSPCTGTPQAGNIAAPNPWDICQGNIITMIDTGYSLVSGLGFQWQSSVNNGANWSVISGATNSYFQTVITGNVLYRVQTTCTATNQTDVTTPLSITVGAPFVYNNIPYSQGFENWISHCNELDIPGVGWENGSSSGDLSWRRDDQGSYGNWSFLNYGYMKAGGDHYARFFSSYSPLDVPADLDLYLDCSGQLGPKGLYFVYANMANKITDALLDLDSLSVLLSTNGGASFTKLATFDTTTYSADFWSKKYLSIISNSPNTIIRFQGKNSDPYPSYYIGPGSFTTDIGIDSISVTQPCSGSPAPAVITSIGGGCAGARYKIIGNGGETAGDLTYQWEKSTNGGANWATIPGNNQPTIEISLYGTTEIRLKTICNGSGLSALSNILTFNITPPNGGYVSLPFIEDFEEWMDYCDSNDVPGQNGITHWVNNPSRGESSCRRDDQGSSAGWYYANNSEMYHPFSISGQHSAKYPTAGIPSFGWLDLLVDCSQPGAKELQFYLNMECNSSLPASIYQTDSFKLLLSTNGGASFSQIGSFRGTNGWDLKKIQFSSGASKTIIRFAPQVLQDNEVKAVGIDLVKVLLPCSGQPAAGIIDSVSTCPNKDFSLHLLGATEASGINYKWQRSADGISWANVLNGTESILIQNIAAPAWFRCILTCNASGLSDTTPARYVQFLSFYYCYCDASPALTGYLASAGSNIEDIILRDSLTQMLVLENGNPALNGTYTNGNYYPVLYSNYQSLNPAILYRDTSYFVSLMQTLFDGGNAAPGVASLFIDFNRDGVYDTSGERVFSAVYDYNEYVDSAWFRVPVNAQYGLTGMRAVLKTQVNYFANPFPGPCDYDNFAGEVEDYIVKIEYLPCTGPLNPGIAAPIDSFLCLGSTLQLSDTTHDNADQIQASQLLWLWESSGNGSNWTDIPGTEMANNLAVIVTAETWYRLKMICQASHDTTHSNMVHVTVKPPYRCYCYSRAEGQNLDRGDIGNYTIGSYSDGAGGAHLNNPLAIESYTDYGSDTSMILYTDSTYDFSVLHIMKTANHQNARITVFMDFNNNFQYDIPAERVFSGLSTANHFLLNDQITIPSSVTTNALTGMRVILNQNFQPNIPSDSACGPYISGETEDYVVKFIANPLEIGAVSEQPGTLLLYPNPTEGKFTLTYKGTIQLHMQITIADITGRLLKSYVFSDVDNGFCTNLDLTCFAKGVYMVKVDLDGKQYLNKVVLK